MTITAYTCSSRYQHHHQTPLPLATSVTRYCTLLLNRHPASQHVSILSSALYTSSMPDAHPLTQYHLLLSRPYSPQSSFCAASHSYRSLPQRSTRSARPPITASRMQQIPRPRTQPHKLLPLPPRRLRTLAQPTRSAPRLHPTSTSST